jgi:hypothetical protein
MKQIEEKRRCNSKRFDAVMPWDPNEQLDLTRMITSMVIQTQVSQGACSSSINILVRLMIVSKIVDYLFLKS